MFAWQDSSYVSGHRLVEREPVSLNLFKRGNTVFQWFFIAKATCSIPSNHLGAVSTAGKAVEGITL